MHKNELDKETEVSKQAIKSSAQQLIKLKHQKAKKQAAKNNRCSIQAD